MGAQPRGPRLLGGGTRASRRRRRRGPGAVGGGLRRTCGRDCGHRWCSLSLSLFLSLSLSLPSFSASGPTVREDLHRNNSLRACRLAARHAPLPRAAFGAVCGRSSLPPSLPQVSPPPRPTLAPSRRSLGAPAACAGLRHASRRRRRPPSPFPVERGGGGSGMCCPDGAAGRRAMISESGLSDRGAPWSEAFRSRGNSRIECCTELLTLASESAGGHEPVVGGSFRRW